MVESILIIDIIIVTQLWCKLDLRYEYEFRADAACVVQYDKDDNDEFLIKKGSRYYLTDQKQTSHFQINLPEPSINYFRCLETDGNPPKEMIFQQFKNDTLWVSIYSDTKLIHRFPSVIGKDIAPPEGWDGALNDVDMIDANDDGYKDILFSVNVAFDLRPRGIWMYDFKHNRKLWHFWIGGSPRTLCVTDINSDGNDEIIISNAAVANGNIANGFSDTISYVIALDRKGNVLWSREIGGVFSDAVCWVGDLDNDDEIEVVVAECEGPASKKEPNQLLILNAQNGETKKYIRSGDKYLGMVVCDINRDEKQEIILGNTDKVLRVYNYDLNLIMQKDMGTKCTIRGATDLDGNGSFELLMRKPENRLLILNEYLMELCEYSSKKGEKSQLIVCEAKKKKLLVQTGDKPPYLYTLLSASGPNFLSSTLRTQPLVYTVIVILLALIIAYLLFQQIKLRKNLKTKQEHADRVLEWSGIAQRLAHEIKNPLSTINLALHRIQDITKTKIGSESQTLDKYTNSVLEEVERLRETTNRFMRILSLEPPKLEPNDINRLIEMVLEKYNTTLPQNIKIEKHLSDNLPLVTCDETQIISVLCNIIENALEAMQGSGVLTIHTSLNEKIVDKKIEKSVEIKIEDTGKGISKENLKNLFKPCHSTKAGGTGLGLVITKRIIEEHRGKITVESKEDIGTIVTMQLPVEKNQYNE